MAGRKTKKARQGPEEDKTMAQSKQATKRRAGDALDEASETEPAAPGGDDDPAPETKKPRYETPVKTENKSESPSERPSRNRQPPERYRDTISPTIEKSIKTNDQAKAKVNGAPKKGVWSEGHLLQNSKSILGHVDLLPIFTDPVCFAAVAVETKTELATLLPEHFLVAGQDGAAKSIDVELLRYNMDFRQALRCFQEDLKAGHYDPDWLWEADQAMEERAEGVFDNYEAETFEETWGVKFERRQCKRKHDLDSEEDESDGEREGKRARTSEPKTKDKVSAEPVKAKAGAQDKPETGALNKSMEKSEAKVNGKTQDEAEVKDPNKSREEVDIKGRDKTPNKTQDKSRDKSEAKDRVKSQDTLQSTSKVKATNEPQKKSEGEARDETCSKAQDKLQAQAKPKPKTLEKLQNKARNKAPGTPKVKSQAKSQDEVQAEPQVEIQGETSDEARDKVEPAVNGDSGYDKVKGGQAEAI